MSELDLFEAQVRENIKQLSSHDARVRREAATWLGESGDPSAITRLKQVYEEDPDASVRKAAAYSLGMFRALEREMGGENSARVYELLEDIALRNKRGRRKTISTGCLMRVVVGLLVSLALLLAFNFLIWPRYGAQVAALLNVAGPDGSGATSGTTGTTEADGTPQEQLAALATAIREDATTLQAVYANPDALDCDADFQNPIAYDASSLSDQPELNGLAARLNAQIVQLFTAKAPYNQACAASETALSADQVAGPLATLETLLAELDAIENDMAS